MTTSPEKTGGDEEAVQVLGRIVAVFGNGLRMDGFKSGHQYK